MNFMINKERALNVVLFKLEDNEEINANLKEKIEGLFKAVNVVIPEQGIKEVKRLGAKEGSRPVLITLENIKLKEEIFNKSKEIAEKGLSVNNDYSVLQREDRNKLFNLKKRLLGHDVYAKVRGQKLVIDGQEYDLHDATKLLRNLNLKEWEKTNSGQCSQQISKKRGLPEGNMVELNERAKSFRKDTTIERFFTSSRQANTQEQAK